MNILVATAKAIGVSYFFGKNSKFENYPSEKRDSGKISESRSKKTSQKTVKYSVAKQHVDALTRRFYREMRITDKTTSREDLMKTVRQNVVIHLESKRIYYDMSEINQPIREIRTETFHMNMLQRRMYRRLMYGVAEYTPEQLAIFGKLVTDKIARESYVTKRAIQVLKAKKIYSVETRLLNACFPHAPIGDKDYEWLIDIDKKYTLKKLGISTGEIVTELVSRALLPANFTSLSVSEVKL